MSNELPEEKTCPLYHYKACGDNVCAWRDDETGECAVLTLAKEQRKANRIAMKAFNITLDNIPVVGVTNRVRGVVEKIE